MSITRSTDSGVPQRLGAEVVPDAVPRVGGAAARGAGAGGLSDAPVVSLSAAGGVGHGVAPGDRWELTDLGVGELALLTKRAVDELARRVALAHYGTAETLITAGDLARARARASAPAAPVAAVEPPGLPASPGAGAASDLGDVRGAPAVSSGGSRGGSLDNHEPVSADLLEVGAAVNADGPPLSAGDTEALSNGAFAAELLGLSVRGSDQLRVVGCLAAARVEKVGAWAAEGARSINAWLVRTLHVAPATAGTLIRTGRLIWEHVPAMGRAGLAGAVTFDHVVTARLAATSQVRRDALAERGLVEFMGLVASGDEQLAYQGARLDAGMFAQLTKRIAAMVDPEADERGYADAQEREYLDISPTLGGYHLQGFLTEEHGQQLVTAVQAAIGAPAAGDERTPAQRRAQGLADIAAMVLSQGELGTSGGVRPQIVVTVPYATLEALVAKSAGEVQLASLTGLDPAQWADGTGPLPPSLLAKLACDSALARVVFGPGGEVLNQGRTYRTFTAAQRAALVARDAGCRFPGCTAPPKQCEGHHLVFWSQGGATDMDNAILLCTFHHHWIHDHHITITLTRDGFTFTDPNGTAIA